MPTTVEEVIMSEDLRVLSEELWRKIPDEIKPLRKWFWNDYRLNLYDWLSDGLRQPNQPLEIIVLSGGLITFGFTSLAQFFQMLDNLRVAWKDIFIVSAPISHQGSFRILFTRVS